MSVLLSSIMGGSGFTARGIFGGVSGAGVSTVVSVTPPTGQRVKLTRLETMDPTSRQGNVRVTFGGVDIFNSSAISVLDNYATSTVANCFSVGYIKEGASTTLSPNRAVREVLGKVNETMVIDLTFAQVTTYNIAYGYSIGE